MKKLIFNNIVAKDLGFIVTASSSEILTQEVFEEVEVEGRNGSLMINKGYYPSITREFSITTIEHFEDDEIPALIGKIKDWLFNITDSRLFYAYEDRYHIVQKVVVEDIQTSLEEFGDFIVKFICEPFLYLVEADLDLNKSMTYANTGDFPSYPNVTIYGNGDITFTINDNSFSIKNVAISVNIDSKLMACVDSEGNNKLQDMTGDFLTLDKEDNMISWSGNITRVIITPRTIFR